MNALLVLLVICTIAVLVLAQPRPARWQREPFRAGSKSVPRRILVTGATGFIGRHLCRRIVARGDQLLVLTRDRARASDLFGPHATVVTSLDEIADTTRLDGIVNLAGAPIFQRPWTQRRRQQLIVSRTAVTEALVRLIVRLRTRPQVLVSASAVGFYGVRGDEELTEADRPRPMFQSQLCQLWELAAQKARDHGVRVCMLRFGVVLGSDGGALADQWRVAQMRIRVVLGEGAQWLSWIHIEDALRLIEHALDHPALAGAVNATAPQPVRQREFADALAAQAGRALTVHVPQSALRRLLGERAQLLLDGQRVLPMRARCSGFEFRFPDIRSALASLCGPASAAPHDILYDSLCPVCDAEMRGYSRTACRLGRNWRFADVATREELIQRYRLDLATARKRVYVLDETGTMRSGIDALMLIWAGLPGWRVLAALLRVPPIKAAADWFYDCLLAPAIWRWNQRRRAELQASR